MAMPVTNTTHQPFLERLFDADIGNDWLNLFTVDFRNGQRSVIWRQNPAELDDIADDLPHANVWFSAATRRQRADNGRRGGNKDCRLIPALWVDIDIAGPNHPDNDRLPANIDDAHKLLASYPMPPTVIVNTGGGIQAWWKLAEPLDLDTDGDGLLDRWRATWQANADQLGWHIDNVFDPARIMRLPGSWNHKTQPPQHVTITHASWDTTYGHDDIDQWLIEPATTPTPAVNERTVPYIGPDRPGDAYNVRHTGAHVLENAGFVLARTDQNGDRHYTRPGKDTREGTSATVYADDGHTTIWSDTCQNMWSTLQVRRPYDPFGLYTHLNHRGDYTASSRHLQQQGYGNQPDTSNPDDLIGDTLRQHNAEQEGPPKPHRLRANLHRGDDILKLPPTEWLIPGVIQKAGLTVTYGAPKSYKTFTVLDRALHLANGRPWRGLEVRRTRVLYVVAEGAPGVGPRASAWCDRWEARMDGVDWITVAPNLFDERLGADTFVLAEIIAELGSEHVVFDTFARSTAGADENSGKDMGLIVDHLTWLIEQTGCGVELVHHTGKDAARGMRGHSSLQGAIDTSIEVIGDRHAVNARIVDQKNAESDLAWWWRPRAYGSSVVLEPTDGLESSGEVRDVNILRQLQLIDSGDGVAFTAWRDAVVEREIAGKTTFYERLKEMSERGLVANEGSKQRAVWRLTLDGIDFLRRAAG